MSREEDILQSIIDGGDPALLEPPQSRGETLLQAVHAEIRETKAKEATNAESIAELQNTGVDTIARAGVAANASQLAQIPNYRKVSGNPAKFYPVPLSSLAVKTLLTATQSGTGDPSPTNIRPIVPSVAASGTVKWWRTGKNLVSYLSTLGVGPRDGTNSIISGKTSLSGDVLTISQAYGDGGAFLKFANFSKKSIALGEYVTISFVPQNTVVARVGIGDLLGGGTTAGADGGTHNLTAGVRFTKTIQALSDYRQLAILVQANTSGNTLSIKDFQVEYGSTATPYEPYAGDEYTLTVQQAKYGLPGAEAWLANDGSEGDPTALHTIAAGASPISVVTSYSNVDILIFSSLPGAKSVAGYANDIICDVAKVRLGNWATSGNYECAHNGVDFYIAAPKGTATLPFAINVIYPLATPKTATGSAVSIPALPALDRYTPRQNVVALDKGTAEVGYAKSPIRTEDELLAAIAALA